MPPLTRAQVTGALLEAAGDDLPQLLAEAESASPFEHPARRGVVAVGEDLVPQVVDGLAARGDRGDDRDLPAGVGGLGALARQLEHLLQVATGLLDAGAVGLVDHEDVGDLHQPGLVGLHAVAPSRVDDDDGGVGLAGDLDLDLPDADGLDEDPAVPEGVEQADRLRRRQRARRGGRVAIERMNTPASVAWSCMRTRSPRIAPPVNGDDGSTASTATSSPSDRQVGDQRARQRALAGAGGTGHPIV